MAVLLRRCGAAEVNGDAESSRLHRHGRRGRNPTALEAPTGVTQSCRMSLVEAATNVVVGYALAVGMQIAVFPAFGIHIALGEHLVIGLVFTGISLVRGYVLRRLFERWL